MISQEADVRTRLESAALALFHERGYDQTTVAQIAARVGVTERTFFRYFQDKREALFGGEVLIRDALTASIADAPASLTPMDTLFQAFRSLQPTHEAGRRSLTLRHEVIATTPALREREVTKMNALSDSLAAALRARGVPRLRAALAAQTGMAAFAHAVHAWLEQPEAGLGDIIDLVERELRSLTVERG